MGDSGMKRVYITTIVTALLLVAAFSMVYSVWDGTTRVDALKVGFIYENDESTPYTCNFSQGHDKLREALYEVVGMRWRYWKDKKSLQDLQMKTAGK